MGFYRKIKYFLVHTLQYSNKEAQALIEGGHVELDGNVVLENCILKDTDEIKVHGKIERLGKELVYLKFNKPMGFESTLNKNNVNSISGFFPNHADLGIAGRLDKYSQGLLLLSNDGSWIEYICNPNSEKEKEYLVTVNKEVDHAFIETFQKGVRIGDYTTRPCKCKRISANTINVILTEGKNRQIRRMCKKLGYSVTSLQRIRVAGIHLEGLSEGKFAPIEPIALQ